MAPRLCFLALSGVALAEAFVAPSASQHSVAGPQQAARQTGPIIEEKNGSWESSALLAVGLVLAAGAAVRGSKRSPAVLRRGVTEIVVAEDAPFAGGLVGSKYHYEPGTMSAGTYEWDPLQLSKRWPEHLPWYREAELKHGRAAMLAFVGCIAPDFFRLPIPECEDPSLDLINAHNKLITGLGSGPMWYLMLVVGSIESIRFKQLGLDFGELTLENAGDWGLRAFAPKTEEGMELMKTKELKNGRLAMMAVSGIFTQAVIYDNAHFPWTLQ